MLESNSNEPNSKNDLKDMSNQLHQPDNLDEFLTSRVEPIKVYSVYGTLIGVEQAYNLIKTHNFHISTGNQVKSPYAPDYERIHMSNLNAYVIDRYPSCDADHIYDTVCGTVANLFNVAICSYTKLKSYDTVKFDDFIKNTGFVLGVLVDDSVVETGNDLVKRIKNFDSSKYANMYDVLVSDMLGIDQGIPQHHFLLDPHVNSYHQKYYSDLLVDDKILEENCFSGSLPENTIGDLIDYFNRNKQL